MFLSLDSLNSQLYQISIYLFLDASESKIIKVSVTARMKPVAIKHEAVSIIKFSITNKQNLEKKIQNKLIRFHWYTMRIGTKTNAFISIYIEREREREREWGVYMCSRFDDDVRITATDVADGEVETALDANAEQTHCFVHKGRRQRRRRRRIHLHPNEALILETNQTPPLVGQ